MHGDAARHPDADRAHLPVRAAVSGDPYTAAPVDPGGDHARVRAAPDQRFLQGPHVGDHVQRFGQRHDRVPDELPRPVPGDLAAPVHVDHRDPGIGQRAVQRLGSPARRVHSLVFQQQAGVRDLAVGPAVVQPSLQFPAVEVGDGVRAEARVGEDQLTVHAASLTSERGRSAPPEGTPARRKGPPAPPEGTARPAGTDRPRRWGKARPILGIPACRLRLSGRGCFTVAGGRDCVFDDSDLQRMTPEERARIARVLAGLNAQSLASTPLSQRRRRLLIAACLAGVLLLSVWIGVLEVKLPRDYRAGGWRAAWVGFDIGLLLVFAATAWAAWRRRQVLIVCLIVLAALLCCDAWFDITLDWGTGGFMVSVLSAALVELPLAVVALIGARRLLRLTIGRLELLAGSPGPVPSFWQVPLFGDCPGSYRTLLRKPPDLVGPDAGPAGKGAELAGRDTG